MMSKVRTRAIAAYELAAGSALVAYGVATGAWWTAVVGALLFAAGVAVGFGRGEATSWLRGDLDERRQRALDHAFRSAFIALTWWLAGCAIVADRRDVPVAGWTAGVVVALVVAAIDYAAVLRRI